MTPRPIIANTLFYGDNLTILREYVPTESVDLIYLDPPFNSNRSYNVLFRDESGKAAEAQLVAFDDTWHWGEGAEGTYRDLVTGGPPDVGKMIGAFRGFIGENQMLAYLVMMAARLVELHRVLKPTGSLYLHCDPTASHYLKVVLDTVFGPENFRNEIVWKRTSAHNTTTRRLGDITDVIFFYSKSDKYYFAPPRQPHSEEYVSQFYRFTEPDGRRYRLHLVERNQALGIRPNLIYEYKGYTPVWGWMMERTKLEQLDKEGKLVWSSNGRPSRKIYLDEVKQPVIANLWDDIQPIQAQAVERLGYPTQKPLALLERIVQASSNPGDVVLDPFCGCGTAIAAAEKLGRRWIGIDITHLAIAAIKGRMARMFPGIKFAVVGEPEDLGAARQLARDDRYQFQWWACSLVTAMPQGSQGDSKVGRKGSDKGIDGVITFLDDATGKPKQVIVQVKSGHVKSGDIRDLVGVLDREKAAIGVFITLEPPTADMQTEAVKAGFYHSPGWNRDYRRVQLLTIEQLLKGATVQMPPTSQTFKQAAKVEGKEGQAGLGI